MRNDNYEGPGRAEQIRRHERQDQDGDAAGVLLPRGHLQNPDRTVSSLYFLKSSRASIWGMPVLQLSTETSCKTVSEAVIKVRGGD